MILTSLLQFIKPYLLTILIIVGLFVTWKAYDYGVTSTSAKYERMILEETERQRGIFNRIQAETRQQIVEHEDQIKHLQELLKENEDEAANDPNADRPALGIPSVQRLNRIR